MNIDTEKIDEMVLALLFLGLHGDENENRAWKSFDWDAMDRLHQKELITNPARKTKSIEFTKEGLERARMLFEKYFASEK